VTDHLEVISLSSRVAQSSYLGCKTLIRDTDIQVQAPAMYVPTDEQFWSKEDPTKPDIAFLKNHFYREGRLTEEQALYILSK
jgi:serine/threonine-protein phosphatase 2B catalytic subunit